MTINELNNANKLKEQIEKENNNVSFLRYALDYHIKQPRNPIKTFMMNFLDKDKTKLKLSGESISFGGYLIVNREFLEYAEEFFIKRRDALIEELNAL